MTKKVQYIVNKPVHGYKIGQKVTLEVDTNGVPLDRLWRRRVRDARLDGCIEKFVPPKPTKTQAAQEDKD